MAITPGTLGGCIGSWFSGEWYDSGATGYISDVKGFLSNQTWRWIGAAILCGRLRTELILAVGVVLKVVLVLVLGLPERTGLADLGHDLAGPYA
jgi:hypothetical protein